MTKAMQNKVDAIRAEKKARSIDWYTNTYSCIGYFKQEIDFMRAQRAFEDMMSNPYLTAGECEQCLLFFYPQFVEQAELVAKKKKGFKLRCKSYNEMVGISLAMKI